MKLSVENGDKGRLYDANGLEVPKVIEADTESGLVTHFVVDSEGRCILNERKDGALKVTEVFPAPLVFVRRVDD